MVQRVNNPQTMAVGFGQRAVRTFDDPNFRRRTCSRTSRSNDRARTDPVTFYQVGRDDPEIDLLTRFQRTGDCSLHAFRQSYLKLLQCCHLGDHALRTGAQSETLLDLCGHRVRRNVQVIESSGLRWDVRMPETVLRSQTYEWSSSWQLVFLEANGAEVRSDGQIAIS